MFHPIFLKRDGTSALDVGRACWSPGPLPPRDPRPAQHAQLLSGLLELLDGHGALECLQQGFPEFPVGHGDQRCKPSHKKDRKEPETLNSEGARPEQPLENWGPFPEANGSFRRSGGVHRWSLV